METTPPKAKKRILVADDAPDIIVVVQRALESAGYEVLTATNGKEAYQKAIEQKPDMIISDILMPLMNGFKLCDELKNNPQYGHIPIILMTAVYRQPDHVEMGFKFGADAYMAKPFKTEQLLEIAKQLLQKTITSPLPPRPSILIKS
ncbi:MAG: response regulator [bacterium]|nr:response regulator [bacterium]